MCNHDQVEIRLFHWRQIEWQRMLAFAVDENPIRLLTNPTLSSPCLFSRFLDGFLKPSLPITLHIT